MTHEISKLCVNLVFNFAFTCLLPNVPGSVLPECFSFFIGNKFSFHCWLKI